MKILEILGCVLLVMFCDVVLSAGDDQVDKMSEFCKMQEKATDKDMENWKNNILPKPKIVKCLNACVGEKLGMLTNNKLNVEKIVQIIEMENTNEKVISDLKAVIDECKSISDPDRCEMSAKVLDCVNDGCRKRGMKEIF